MVVFENYPYDEASAAQSGLRIRQVDALDTTNFPLTLRAYLAGELHVDLGYDPHLFTATTAEQITSRLRMLLTAIAEDADRPLFQLPWMSAQERQHVLSRGNGGRRVAGRAPAETLVGVFEAQAARTPDAVAVTCEGAGLSYGQLNARANRLAHWLAELGAGPERLVALALPRSLDLVVATIAALKTGAAYLPIDPQYPAERVTHMLGDAAPVAVLTTGQPGGAQLPGVGGAMARVALDDPEVIATLEGQPAQNLTDADRRGSLEPGTPAYVIYTSGSTGKPKGVVIPHGNVVRLFSATRDWFAFDSRDVWTMFHSHAFDFSVWEIWGPLLHGGRLVIVPHEVSRSPEEFLRLLAAERVTVLNQTPFGVLPADGG